MTARSDPGKSAGTEFSRAEDRFARADCFVRPDHSVTADDPESVSGEEEVPVLLTVIGKQTDPDGNTQESTAVYRAVCRNKGEGYLFSYFAEGTEVSLFLSRDRAWMQRGPGRSARMVFDPSADSTSCSYETDYGSIPMEIRTQGISVLAGELRRKALKGRENITDRKDSNSSGNSGVEILRSVRGLQARIRYTLIMAPKYELSCSVTIKTQQTD